MYDDRSPVFGQASNQRPPPPMPSYRSRYAETERSHDMRSNSRHSMQPPIDTSPLSAPRSSRPVSRYSEPISPGARPVSVPSEAFQYGSGPIPSGPMMGSERSFYHTRPASVVVTNAPGVDPAWLNEILTKAVKRGVEESRRNEPPSEIHTQHIRNVETASQPPGAWPESPFSPGAQPVLSPQHAPRSQYVAEGDIGTTIHGSESRWGSDQVQKKTKSRVNWSAEPEWSSDSKVVDWTTPEEPASDSWDTDATWETWGTEKSKAKPASQWSQSKPPSARSRSETRGVSPVTNRHHQAPRSERHGSHKSRSKSRPKTYSWSERRKSAFDDGDGWTRVEATSDSSGESDSTVRESKTYIGSKKSSKRTKSMSTKSRKSVFDLRGGANSRAPSIHTHAPSVGSGPTPTIMNGTPFMQPPAYQPHVAQQGSSFPAPAPSASQAPPFWVPETYKPPNPFSAIADAFAQNANKHRSKSSPKWDSSSQNGPKKSQKAKSIHFMSWPGDDKTGEVQDAWVGNKDTKSNWGAEAEDSWGDTDTGGKNKDDWGAKEETSSGWGAGETSWEVKSTSKEGTKAKDSQWDTTAALWNSNGNSDDATKNNQAAS
jgi:hypothetical protein